VQGRSIEGARRRRSHGRRARGVRALGSPAPQRAGRLAPSAAVDPGPRRALSDAAGLIGRSVRRVEDRRLLTGRGCYVADVPLESALHVAVVRSPHAHARVIRIDLDAARATRGVVGAFTPGDLPELRRPLPPAALPAAPI